MNLQRILYPLRTLASAAIAALTLALTPAKAHAAPPTPPAPAASNAPVTMSNIFSFTNQQSLASLVQGTNGNFYGTTATGGTNSDGAVFMLSPAGAFTNLVSFAGTNGATPLAPLFLAKDGNFYGTTSSGGVGNDGTIFSLSPSGAFTNRFKFTGSNGAAPNGGLAQGSNGLFYGTTSAGGSNKLGEVFSWSLSRGVSNLHSFTGTDGSSPLAGVVVATNGYLYGTTSSGGANGLGTVFELVPTNKNKLTTLVSFALDQGAAPLGLVPAPGGNFYGVTSQGGSNGIGTVFKVTTSGRLTVLASFAISNGSNPKAPLLLGSDGFLYGTTEQGGTNGKGTLFRLSTNGGALSTLVTFQGANGAYPQAGLLQASDGNIYGTTSGGGANSSGIVFELSGFAPTISQQPTNQGFTAEKSINFFVQAAGSQPLFYQWLFDGVSLTNTNNLSGATTNHLTISTASLTNSGSYSVIVSNAYGAVTSSVAKLTLPAPTLTIKPRPPATVTNAGLTVQGTATGKYGVTNVFYQVLNQTNSGTNWTTVTTNGWTNAPTNLDWSVTVTLQGGSNIFEAYSVDPVGDPSPTNSVKVFYLTRSLLTLMTTGDGTISPRVSDTNLVVDRAFTVRARPGPDNLFSNWTGTNLTGTNVTGTFTNTSNPWTFLMSSNNMYLTANFVTNPFLQFHAAGTYDGLFSVSNTAAPSSGIIKNLRVGTLGTYTGRLYIGGSNYSLSGAFDVAGNATEQIAKTTAGTLTLAMNLNWTNIPPQITGTVAGKSGSSWTASLLAELAGTNLASAAYTMLLPPGTNSAVASPPGFGYATITNHAGSLTLKGALADAAAFSETVAETASSNLLIYAAPYSGDGLLLGRLTLTNGPPEGSLTWIKPASSTGLFTNGYTNVVTVESSLWTSPQAKTPALPLPNAQLLVSNAGLLLSFHAAVTDSNALAKLGRIPTNSLSGSINPKNGRLTLSFGNTNGRAAIAGAGAVLQNQTNARGYFVSKTNYGSILLQNEPQGIAPVIYQQPAAEKFTNNATVHFSVGAAGSEPLEYQWVMDGSILTNGGDISGATNNLLAIAGESLATSGSYSVIVSNAYGAVTSSVANLTLPAPTLTIKPRPPATVTSAALTVQGTAAGKYGVTNVFFQVLNQAGPGTNWTPVTTNGWTGAPASVDWSANVTLRGGSNIFEAYSVDPVGNPSLTSRVNVFYLTHSLLTLTTIGDGTIGPRDLGSNLVVGRPYTISAAPAKNNLFSNWTGSLTNSSSRLTFLMVSNMSLTANFVPNPFLKAQVAGTYNGLFSLSNAAAASSGMIKSLKIGTPGTYSGTLHIAGSDYSLSGAFDVAGNAGETIHRASALGDLSLAMNLDWNTNPPQITGAVQGKNGGSWTAPLRAELAGSGLGSAAYTILIPPATNTAVQSPPGYGYATITNHAGAATVTGALADGAAFSETAAESASSNLLIYSTPYSNDGLLLGWLTLTNGAPEGSLTWIKPKNSTGLFTNGYTNIVSVESSLWSNPAPRTAAVSLTNAPLVVSTILYITNSSLPFTNLLFTNIVLAADNDLLNSGAQPTNKFSGAIKPKTGKFTVSITDAVGDETISGAGAVLQDHTNAAGYFVTKTNAGAILLNWPSP